MSLTLLTRGGSEPWKGAEPWGSPEAGACFPCQVKEGSRLAPSRPSLPAGDGRLGRAALGTHGAHARKTCTSGVWRPHTHTVLLALYVWNVKVANNVRK